MADTTCSEYEEDDTVDAIIDKLDSSRVSPRVSPLADACREGHVDIVRLLIEKGAKIQTKCVEYASSRGNIEIVKLLHGVKGDIIKKGYGLYGASAMGQTEVVRFLLQQGAIPEHGCLQRTCTYGHVDVVKLLIAAGAGFNKGIRLARKYGHPEIVQLLIDAGGNPSVNEGKIVDEWVDFEICDKHHIAFPGSPHVYRKRRDAKLVAFCMSCKTGRIEQVIHHLDNGADINTEYQGLSPAAWACGSGHIDIVRLLMERGAKPSLFWFIQASGGGHVNIINLLMGGGGVDHYYIECGLRAASLRGHKDVVQLLLDLDQHVVPKNDSFEAACRYGYISIVKLLLAAGAHYNCSIGCASRCGHTKVVQILIDAGGNPNAIDIPLCKRLSILAQ